MKTLTVKNNTLQAQMYIYLDLPLCVVSDTPIFILYPYVEPVYIYHYISFKLLYLCW